MAYVLARPRQPLKNLTDRRAKPAVYFAERRGSSISRFKCAEFGIRRIRRRHAVQGPLVDPAPPAPAELLPARAYESFDILPASQRVSETQWYEGTADAVYQNIDIIEDHGVEYMVILAGDHVYKMDYELMLQQHVDSGADVTVGCLEVPRMEATGFGVMHVDNADRIIAFVEKPADPPGIPAIRTWHSRPWASTCSTRNS